MHTPTGTSGSYTGTYYCKSNNGTESSLPFNVPLGSFYGACAAPTVWNEQLKICWTPCSSRQDRQWNPGQVGIVNGSTTCDNGCLGVIFNNSGSPGFTVTYAGGLQCTAPPFPNGCEAAQTSLGWRNHPQVAGVCLPPSSACPDGSAKDPVTGECGNDTCPQGMVLNAQGQCETQGDNCPAGQTRAPDGSCQGGNDNCPAGQVKGPDGTCKPDGDGDGEPDEGSADSFSGGESCDVPPTCSGDVIMCGMARIQWRIDCNTRNEAKINGGSCNAIPVCTGKNCNALEYAQLIQQWKASCALERLAENGIQNGGGDDGTTASYDPTEDAVAVTDSTAGQGDPDDAFTDGSGNNGGAGGNPGGDGQLDSSGLGYGTSCPNLPSVNVFGATVDFQAAIGADMCDWFRLGGHILLVLAALLSLRILASGMSV
ncbi:hypothetical protein [Luteimonas sp. SDU82]|uniref:hypothetical protein n=1 Tax=Luteimonas sp. SDU82 TaxID=3422592 RepID=UPI003EBBE036